MAEALRIKKAPGRPRKLKPGQEQTYGTMSLHRRLVRDYEHDPASAESRVYWAMTDVMSRRLTGPSAPVWRDT